MLLNVVFVYCITVATANYDIFNTFFNGIDVSEENQTLSYRRFPRSYKKKRNDFEVNALTCDQMERTYRSPFVVIFLFKSSGRYLGLGAIIDKTTILTATKVVENAVQHPEELLALAGRLSPWWGKNSQVKQSLEIHVNEVQGLALVLLKNPFRYNKNVSPIKIPLKVEKDFEKAYDIHYMIYGVPRSSWDVPGQPVPQSTVYLASVETMLRKKEDLDPCKKNFPDFDFNSSTHVCVSANTTFCWGVMGSPVIAVTKKGKVVLVGIVTKATNNENDLYHVFSRVPHFVQWIRSMSFINFHEE